MVEWLSNNGELVAAASTLGLALFAGVQIALEIWRQRESKRAAAIHARGPAWLARRTLEHAARSANEFSEDPQGWAWMVRKDSALDSLEAMMLEALRLASIAGGEYATAAGGAFDSFLAFVDRANLLAAYQLSGRGALGSTVATAEDEARLGALFDEATFHLAPAIGELAKIAPRQPHEHPTPTVRWLRVEDVSHDNVLQETSRTEGGLRV